MSRATRHASGAGSWAALPPLLPLPAAAPPLGSPLAAPLPPELAAACHRSHTTYQKLKLKAEEVQVGTLYIKGRKPNLCATLIGPASVAF